MKIIEKIIDHTNWLNDKKGSQLDIENEEISIFNFENIDLNSGIFTNVNFFEIDIININFSGSYFFNCVFKNIIFININLRKSEFHDCHFVNCSIEKSNITKAEFFNLKANNVSFLEVDLGWTFIDSSSFVESTFDEVVLEGTIFSDTKTVNTKFKNLIFSKKYPLKYSENKNITFIEDEKKLIRKTTII
ncbi:pentapeptide repeat-containing protein [Aquimarina aquimarini]|uniref:pentapeptide repeat-containing protein n=1 Tax=Aquimarina aquimarini TaxID=1191734 RepID=UPI000D55103D|nr:pentapeptide repeat-containing protein [Aquimarina aquimarini]